MTEEGASTASRGWLRAVVFLGAFVALVVIVGLVLAPERPAPATWPARQKPVVGKYGQLLTDRNLTFMVTGLDLVPEERIEAAGYEPKKGRLWAVTVTVTNTGDEQEVFSDTLQTMWARDEPYYADNLAAEAIYPDDSLFFVALDPDEMVTGVIVFDLPPAISPEEVELREDVRSRGVKVKLM